jgi:DNA-directed RNA polymerase subunit beta'
MAIKFTAMKQDDYLSIGKEVKDTFTKDPYSMLEAGLSSSTLFGNREMVGEFTKSAERDHVRAYIKLAAPVLNRMLAQENAALLSKILGKDSNDAKSICKFERVYDKHEKRLISIDEAKDTKDILCGAEIFRMWIDELDINEAIEESFLHTFKLRKDYVAFNKSGNGIKLPGGWFVESNDGPPLDIPTNVIFSCFRSPGTRLAYLLNMTSKENLRQCCSDFIVVVPIGMRPDIDNRHDPLSKLYADIVSANNALKLAIAGRFSPAEYVAHYRALDTAVARLMNNPTTNKPGRKPVRERVSGKEGFIRNQMLGKRVDYSGRSVITINPTLSIKNIGIPTKMAPKLFRYHTLSNRKNPDVSKVIGSDNNAKICKQLLSNNILKDVPVLIGRQPTLHRLSMQAYEAQLVDSRSIQINPLMVTAFNADFDGDQMWVRTVNSTPAVEEVKKLLLTNRNMFLPDNGEIAVMPRHEIVYGLNVCTRDVYRKTTPVASFSGEAELREAIYMQDVKVSQTVTCMGETDIAGKLIVKSCLKPYNTGNLTEITATAIKKHVSELFKFGVDTMIACVDKLVELGFKISELYPPTIRLLDDVDMGDLYKNFYDKMEDALTWYERGYEEEETYSMLFDNLYAEIDDNVKEHIVELAGKENGITRMSESGARGSKSNMMQIYAHKGRVQKNSRDSFKSVVENSYTEQLTSLEHFITSFGGRNGLIAKNINTSDTGYLSRQMWHACQPVVIHSNDCGTTKGITIDKVYIAMNYSRKELIDEIFIHMISGRYLTDGSYVTDERAKELCRTKESVAIRSPLTCDKPCCKKCYGEDPTTHEVVAVGAPVGFVAAQSIGRIGTQLSMDNFKKGGVTNKGDIVSSFARMEALVNMLNLHNNRKFATYDPVAWSDGEIIESIEDEGSKRVSIKGSRKSVHIPSGAILKSVAVRGEGMCLERGDYDVNELLAYAGLEAAQKYLIHELYGIYRDETEVSLKHFEVLVMSMTMAMVLNTDRKDLKVCQFHDLVQLKSGPLDNTQYALTLKGVKRIQTLRPMPLSGILMEEVSRGISEAVLMEMVDPLEYPLNRILLGLGTKQGTYYNGYIDSRR